MSIKLIAFSMAPPFGFQDSAGCFCAQTSEPDAHCCTNDVQTFSVAELQILKIRGALEWTSTYLGTDITCVDYEYNLKSNK